jgi:opacity protein-like surface antigen
MIRLSLGLVLAALCLGEQTAHAQVAPVPYLTPGWSSGFASSSFGDSRYDFANGWFVGSERGTGFAASSFSSNPAFSPLSRDSVQFGYNFKDSGAPVALFAGFDSLKSNAGTGSIFAPFSQSPAGYGAHAGVEFKPTSNLSLSLGASFTQLSGRPNTDTTPQMITQDNAFTLLGARP